MKHAKFIFSTLALLIILGHESSAYDTIEVKNGGSIKGVVEFAGAVVPKDPILSLSSDAEYCGKSLPARKYLIRNRKIENAVVSIRGIKSGKAIPHEAVVVTNLKCEFVPHVAVGFKGNKFTAKNDDPIFHQFDLHASLEGKEIYSVSLHDKGSSATKTLLRTGILELSCYVHPWQHAYVDIFDHPYATVTDEKGRFLIENVPPGTYTVDAWHEALGIIKSSDIHVESGKTSTLKLEYTKEVNLE